MQEVVPKFVCKKALAKSVSDIDAPVEHFPCDRNRKFLFERVARENLKNTNKESPSLPLIF